MPTDRFEIGGQTRKEVLFNCPSDQLFEGLSRARMYQMTLLNSNATEKGKNAHHRKLRKVL